MRLAIVHDYLREWGGAEEVVKTIHEIWPKAPIFTSYTTTNFPKTDWQTKTSFMQYLPEKLRVWRGLTPLLPLAFRQFHFERFDVVLSSSASFAKSIQVSKPTVHICYCHTPPRFLYNLKREQKASLLGSIAEAPFLPFLAKADVKAARGVDHFIANSNVVAARIKHTYKRDATVIHPPVDIDKFVTNNRGGEGSYFVTLGRLSPIKRFDLAIAACTKLSIPLRVIGEGSEESYLRSLAGDNVAFLGKQTNEEIARVLQGAKAVISTVLDEDFGIVPLEILGAGVPVIAFASPASKETMVDGVTGKFFTKPTVDNLAEVLLKFDHTRYNPQVLRDHAKRYRKERFMAEIKAFVEKAVLK